MGPSAQLQRAQEAVWSGCLGPMHLSGGLQMAVSTGAHNGQVGHIWARPLCTQGAEAQGAAPPPNEPPSRTPATQSPPTAPWATLKRSKSNEFIQKRPLHQTKKMNPPSGQFTKPGRGQGTEERRQEGSSRSGFPSPGFPAAAVATIVTIRERPGLHRAENRGQRGSPDLWPGRDAHGHLLPLRVSGFGLRPHLSFLV